MLVARALDESISLTDVDLASNELTDAFGLELCKVLRVNHTIWKARAGASPRVPADLCSACAGEVRRIVIQGQASERVQRVCRFGGSV